MKFKNNGLLKRREIQLINEINWFLADHDGKFPEGYAFGKTQCRYALAGYGCSRDMCMKAGGMYFIEYDKNNHYEYEITQFSELEFNDTNFPDYGRPVKRVIFRNNNFKHKKSNGHMNICWLF